MPISAHAPANAGQKTLDAAPTVVFISPGRTTLVAGTVERWPLAGDQLYVDLDLSTSNLPPGTRLAVGSAVIEVTAEPHTGCRKFAARFGREATQFVNWGKDLNLRGVNAKIIRAGTVRVGDMVRKL